MKNLSRTGSRVLIMLLVQIMVLGLLMPASAQADEPNGLVNVNDKYYFYSNGKAVHNKWIKAPVDGVMQKFYFGKSGAACKAGRLYENAYNVKLFRIKGVKYGFDMNSFLVKPGIYVNGAFQLMAFGKNGKYNEAKTKKLRKKLPIGKISKGMYKKVISTLGKPLSVSFSDSCSPWKSTGSFTDVKMTYNHFEVQLIREDRTKQYMLDGFFPI